MENVLLWTTVGTVAAVLTSFGFIALYFRYRQAKAQGVIQATIRGAQEMGIDPLVAVRESARGLVKAAADEGANVAVVARAALEEALEGTQARDIQVEAREAAAAVAEGLQQGAAELGDRTVRPVRQAVSDILADMEAEGA